MGGGVFLADTGMNFADTCRRKKEAEERAAQAIAMRRKMETESEAKSGAEEKRRAQELEDQRFQEADARRRKEEMQARLREQQERTNQTHARCNCVVATRAWLSGR